MVAKGKATTRHVLRDRDLPKFVHHTDFAGADSREYLQGIDLLLHQPHPPAGHDEARLFMAMHYCAFRVRRARGKRLMLTAAAQRWIRRRDRIREHLIVVNLGLAYEMLRRTSFTNVDEDELLGEGLRALCDAVEAFDPWRGFRFSTYACNAIYRGFLRLSKLESRRASVLSFGFDARMERGAGEISAADWDERTYASRLRRVMDDNLADLSATERYIISRRFPERSDVKRQTLERLGREMQVSKEHVRQIQLNALEKIRMTLVAEPVLA